MTEMSRILDSIEEALRNRNRKKDSEAADVWVVLFRAAIDELVSTESTVSTVSTDVERING